MGDRVRMRRDGGMYGAVGSGDRIPYDRRFGQAAQGEVQTEDGDGTRLARSGPA